MSIEYKCAACGRTVVNNSPTFGACRWCLASADETLGITTNPPAPTSPPAPPPLSPELFHSATVTLHGPDWTEPIAAEEEIEICYEELGVFDDAWDAVAEQGGCDSRGAAEYRRVSAIWERAGHRLAAAMFILQHANGMTREQAEEWCAQNLDNLFGIE